MNDDQYPEHDKLRALDGKNEVVGDFLVWLQNEGYTICRWQESKRFELGQCERCAERNAQRLRADPFCPYCSGTGNAFEVMPEGFYSAHKPIETWLAEHFGIDQGRLDEEKRQLLVAIRSANPRASS